MANADRLEATRGMALPCPSCRAPTASLKRYRILHFLLFLFVYARLREATITACPACARKIILRRSALNLVTGNLLFLLGYLPFHIHQFVRTFRRGHSAADGHGWLFLYWAVPAATFGIGYLLVQ
jgi:hypothetical protein